MGEISELFGDESRDGGLLLAFVENSIVKLPIFKFHLNGGPKHLKMV